MMTSLANLLVLLGLWLLLWLPWGALIVWRRRTSLTYPVPPEQKLPLLLPLYVLAPLAVWLFQRLGYQDMQPTSGLVWHSQLLATESLGFGLGGLGILLLIGLQLGLGWRQLNRTGASGQGGTEENRQWGLLLALLPLTLFIGGIEEWLFRGVVVNILPTSMSVWAMVIISSSIFAVSHLVWDGMPGFRQLPGLWLMGVVLVLARWAAGGGLGLAMGLHAGWIFGLAVVDALNLLSPGQEAPRWLVGQPDQPLTGIADLGLLTLTGIGLWWYGQGGPLL